MTPSSPDPIAPIDAWAFAALLFGQTLNGELDRVSETNRRFARRLNGMEATQRNSAFDSFLALMDEAESDALAEAVAASDPLKPPPEAEPWPALRLGKLPPVPAFPLDVLPIPARKLVEEAAAAIGCDPAFSASNALAIASGAIGRARALCLASNHFAHACLFVANVGHPGDGKTPALGYVNEAIKRLDRDFLDTFRTQKARYRILLKDAKKEGRDEPEAPVPVRLGVDDTTIEALFRIMASNPRGLVMSRDELVALIKGLNQYKSSGGADRSNVLKIWSGQPFTVDRVLNEMGEPTFIPHPCLSIVGNLTPSSLPLMGSPISGDDDGFFDRWLFAFPDRRRKLKSDQRSRVSDETLADWSEVVDRLWHLEMESKDGRDVPRVVFFSKPGHETFNRLFDVHVDEVNAADFAESLRGPWAKLEEYAGRFALVLAVLDHACDPTADQETIPFVTERIANNAWRLVDFFKAQHVRARAFLEGKGLANAPDGVRTILRWVWGHADAKTFSERDMNRLTPRFARAPEHLEDCLLWLEQRKAIRRQTKPEVGAPRRGRPGSPVWDIHPGLRSPENSEDIQASISDQSPFTQEVTPSQQSAEMPQLTKIGPGQVSDSNSVNSGISADCCREGEEGEDDARPTF